MELLEWQIFHYINETKRIDGGIYHTTLYVLHIYINRYE